MKIQSIRYQIKVILAILLWKGITVLYNKITNAKSNKNYKQNIKIRITNTKI